MSGRYDRFTTAEGTPLSRTLTFPAQTVIIDNISASWAYSTDGGRSIPPWTYGVTLPVSGTTQAALSWNTPAGLHSPVPAGGTATLIYTDDVLAPSNGTQVVTPSQQVPCPVETSPSFSNVTAASLGTSTATIVGGGVTTAAWRVRLSPGINSFLVLTSDNSNPVNISVTGVQSGNNYVVISTADAPTVASIVGAIDTELDITLTSTAVLDNTQWTTLGSYSTQAVAVTTGAEPLVVSGRNSAPVSTSLNPAAGESAVSSAANTAVSIVLTAVAARRWVIDTVTASFSGPTAGSPSLLIANDGGTTVWEATVSNTAAGNPPQHFVFPNGLSPNQDVPNKAVTITLAASGASGIFGVVSATFTDDQV